MAEARKVGLADFVIAASSSSTNITYEQPRLIIPQGYGIYVDGRQFFYARTEAQAQAMIEAITYLNRYYKGARNSVSYERADNQSTDDPYELWWQCSWSQGYMGWNARPLVNPKPGWAERVDHSNEAEKQTLVKAPSAQLAIERSKLACAYQGVLTNA